MQHEASIPQLQEQLAKVSEDPMVRHECAEALGSIAAEKCLETLQGYVKDEARVVRESCIIALDMCEYENSNDFQYANALGKMQGDVKEGLVKSWGFQINDMDSFLFIPFF